MKKTNMMKKSISSVISFSILASVLTVMPSAVSADGENPMNNTKQLALFTDINPVSTYAKAAPDFVWSGQDYNIAKKSVVSRTEGYTNHIGGVIMGNDYLRNFKRSDVASIARGDKAIAIADIKNSGANGQAEVSAIPYEIKSATQAKKANGDLVDAKLFEDNMYGICSRLYHCGNTDDGFYNKLTCADLSDCEEDGYLTFEFRYQPFTNYGFKHDKEKFLNDLYVMVLDLANVYPDFYYTPDKTSATTINAGNTQKATNHVCVRLTDFIDPANVTQGEWCNIKVPLSVFTSFKQDNHYFVRTLKSSNVRTDDRPIDMTYFHGAGLVYIPDEDVASEVTFTDEAAKKNDSADGQRYGFIIDNMRVDDVADPVINAEYLPDTNTSNITWNNANEGFVSYTLFKNGQELANTQTASYTDEAPDVSAEYQVKATLNLSYLQNGNPTPSVITIDKTSENAKIPFSNTAFMLGETEVSATDMGDITVKTACNPGVSGVWIVARYNGFELLDAYDESITLSDRQEVKSYTFTDCSPSDRIKAFIWNNMDEIIPLTDGDVLPTATASN